MLLPNKNVSETRTMENGNKILLVADSVGDVVSLKSLEESTGSKFVSIRPKSSFAPHYSSYNQVIKEQLQKNEFHTLIIQSGAVDISRLDTKVDPLNNIENFERVTTIAAHKTFENAETAFTYSDRLKKVVIMKSLPRYDPQNIDPFNIKHDLAVLF